MGLSLIPLMIAGLLGWLPAAGGGDEAAAQRANRERAPLAERLRTRGFSAGSKVHLRVFKAENRLEVWLERDGRYQLFETYPVCRWSGRLGPKLREGDGQAPEGFYAVPRAALNPNSSYHRSFNLGFPNAHDRALGRTGTFLMVHGDCVSVGCYAMTDPAITELWTLMTAAYDRGQRTVTVDAFPFRFTPARMATSMSGSEGSFWRELAEGDRRFVETGRPAAVWSCAARYRFEGGTGCTPVRAGG
jgi:murein L,D-transpeptidase YafK